MGFPDPTAKQSAVMEFGSPRLFLRLELIVGEGAVCLSVRLLVCAFVSLPVCLLCLFFGMSTFLSVCLRGCLSV